MATSPQSSNNNSTTPIKQYQQNLNRLREMRDEYGRALHQRITLAEEIYNDQEYREKMAAMANLPPETITADTLATAINETMPDLIALEYDFNGTTPGCISLQAILHAFPNPDDWANKTLPDLAYQAAPEPEKTNTTRKSATLKQVATRDSEIKRLKLIIQKLTTQNTQLTQEITKLTQEITQLKQTLTQTHTHIA